MKKSLSFTVVFGILFSLAMATGAFATEPVADTGIVVDVADALEATADLTVGERISDISDAFTSSLKEGIAAAASMLGTGVDAVWDTWQGKTIVLLLVLKYTAGMAGFAFIGALLKACTIISLLTIAWIVGNRQLKGYYTKFLASTAGKASEDAKKKDGGDPWMIWRQGGGINLDGAGMYMVVWLAFNLTMVFSIIACF